MPSFVVKYSLGIYTSTKQSKLQLWMLSIGKNSCFYVVNLMTFQTCCERHLLAMLKMLLVHLGTSMPEPMTKGFELGACMHN